MRIFELSSNFPLKRRKEKKGKNDQTRADFRIFEKKKKKEKRSIISRIIANSQTRPNTFPFPKKIKTKEETSTILSYPPQHSDPRIHTSVNKRVACSKHKFPESDPPFREGGGGGMDGRGTPDGNNLEAVSTLKGSHRDKFHLGATFHPRWRRLPFSEQSQPAQPASLVYHRRHIAGGRVVGETLSLSKEKEEERERLLGVAAVTQLRPHLICLKYTAPPAEVLMATRPHPLLSLSPPFSFFFPPLFPLSRAPFEPRTATMPRGRE